MRWLTLDLCVHRLRPVLRVVKPRSEERKVSGWVNVLLSAKRGPNFTKMVEMRDNGLLRLFESPLLASVLRLVRTP